MTYLSLSKLPVVGDDVPNSAADVRACSVCKTSTFFVPHMVLVLTPGGARRMRLWFCEQHPFPENVTYTGPMAD